MMNGQVEKPLKERLEALAAFLPVFTRADFSPGEWAGGELESAFKSGMLARIVERAAVLAAGTGSSEQKPQ